jgi:hypothetical protein
MPVVNPKLTTAHCSEQRHSELGKIGVKNQFEPLDVGEVLSVRESDLVLIGHHTFRVGEFADAIRAQLRDRVDGWTEDKNAWFSEAGIPCEVLRYTAKGWQKGKVRINLEFCPQEMGDEEFEDTAVSAEDELDLAESPPPEAELNLAEPSAAMEEELDLGASTPAMEEELDLGEPPAMEAEFDLGEPSAVMEEELDLGASAPAMEAEFDLGEPSAVMEEELDLGESAPAMEEEFDLGEPSPVQETEFDFEMPGEGEEEWVPETPSDLYGEMAQSAPAETEAEAIPMPASTEEEFDLGEMEESIDQDLELLEEPGTSDDDLMDLGDISTTNEEEFDFEDISGEGEGELDFGEMSDSGEESFEFEDISAKNEPENGEMDSLLDDVWQDMNEASWQNNQ